MQRSHYLEVQGSRASIWVWRNVRKWEFYFYWYIQAAGTWEPLDLSGSNLNSSGPRWSSQECANALNPQVLCVWRRLFWCRWLLLPGSAPRPITLVFNSQIGSPRPLQEERSDPKHYLPFFIVASGSDQTTVGRGRLRATRNLLLWARTAAGVCMPRPCTHMLLAVHRTADSGNGQLRPQPTLQPVRMQTDWVAPSWEPLQNAQTT